MKEKFSGWRDIDSFHRWETQNADNDREAIANFNRREALTHSQTLARRLLIAAILLVTLGVAAILKYWPK